MTIIDHSRTEDELAVELHAHTETHIKSLRVCYGLSRKAALEHLVAFAENDEEAPVLAQFALAQAPARPRRKRGAEAGA